MNVLGFTASENWPLNNLDLKRDLCPEPWEKKHITELMAALGNDIKKSEQ